LRFELKLFASFRQRNRLFLNDGTNWILFENPLTFLVDVLRSLFLELVENSTFARFPSFNHRLCTYSCVVWTQSKNECCSLVVNLSSFQWPHWAVPNQNMVILSQCFYRLILVNPAASLESCWITTKRHYKHQNFRISTSFSPIFEIYRGTWLLLRMIKRNSFKCIVFLSFLRFISLFEASFSSWNYLNNKVGKWFSMTSLACIHGELVHALLANQSARYMLDML